MTADFSVATAITADDRATRPVDRFARALSTRVVGAADKAKAALGRFAGATKTAVVGAGKLAGVVGVAAGGFALKAAHDFTEAADEIAEFSARVGLNITALQEYRYAAERSGAGLDTFNGAIEKFNVQLGKMKAGSGGLGKFLQKIDKGLAAQVKGASSSEEAFRLMLEAISRLEDPAEQAALAAAAFGGAGKKMILMAKGGVADLDDLRKAAHRFGLITEADAESAGKLDDALIDFKASVKGLEFAIGRGLVPVLTPVVEQFTEWITANREVIGLKVAEWFDTVGTALGKAFRYLRDDVDWAKVGDRLAVIGDVFGKIADAVGWAIDAVGGLENALWLLAGAKLLGALGSVATSVGLIGTGAAAAGGAGAAGATGAAGAGAFGAASKLAVGGAAGIAAGLAWLGWSEMSKDGDWLEAANQNAPSDALAGGALAASGGVVGSVQGLASSRDAEIASRMNSEQLVNAFKTAIEVGFDGQEFWGELVRRGFDGQKLAEYRRATSATVDGSNLWNLDSLAAARRAQMKIEVDFKNAPPNMTATVAERPADVPTTLRVGRRQ